MKKFVACIAMTLFLAARASKDNDKTLAIVNNEPILESEFNNVFGSMLEAHKPHFSPLEAVQRENELKDAVLDMKINEIILKQEAKKQKIKSSKEETQKLISKIKKDYVNESESEFSVWLKEQKMTVTDLEKQISEQIAIQKLLKQTLKHKICAPTDSEIRVFYEKAVTKMKTSEDNIQLPSEDEDVVVLNFAIALKRESSEQVRVRQIFISLPKDASEENVKAARAKVETVKKELKKQTFADVARQYSEDPESRERNGDLGMVAKGDLLPLLDKIAFSIEIGDYTREPVKTDAGFFFLKIEEKRAKKDISFDDVKDKVTEILIELNKYKAQESYIEELKAKAELKINKTW